MQRRRVKPRAPKGYEALDQLQVPKPETLPKVEVSADTDVLLVKSEMERLAGGADELVRKLGLALRKALDLSYNGAETGRFHLAQLSKTEKAHTGTLLELLVQQAFDLADGEKTDYQVLQFDVDAKYTHLTSGSPSWSIGPEIEGCIALLATADDYRGIWSAWLVWVKPGRRNYGLNRDAKASLNDDGKAARVPIAVDCSLPENNLLVRPMEAVAVMRLAGRGKGQARVNEMCRRFDGQLLTRVTVETVAQQLDPTKRMRGNGGARSRLAGEGILVLGHEAQYRPVLEALGLPVPRQGEFLPLAVAPWREDDPEPYFVDLRDRRWRRRRPDEVASGIPILDSRGLAASVAQERLARLTPAEN